MGLIFIWYNCTSYEHEEDTYLNLSSKDNSQTQAVPDPATSFRTLGETDASQFVRCMKNRLQENDVFYKKQQNNTTEAVISFEFT